MLVKHELDDRYEGEVRNLRQYKKISRMEWKRSEIEIRKHTSSATARNGWERCPLTRKTRRRRDTLGARTPEMNVGCNYPFIFVDSKSKLEFARFICLYCQSYWITPRVSMAASMTYQTQPIKLRLLMPPPWWLFKTTSSARTPIAARATRLWSKAPVTHLHHSQPSHSGRLPRLRCRCLWMKMKLKSFFCARCISSRI